MTQEPNSTCAICGNDYYVCLSCENAQSYSSWRAIVDTPNCYKIYQIVKGYNTGKYTKTEARTYLQKTDLSNIESFADNIKIIIKDLLSANDANASNAPVSEAPEGKTSRKRKTNQ